MQAVLLTIIFGLTPLYLVRFRVFDIPTTVFETALYGVFLVVLWSAFRRHEVQKLFSLPKETLFRVGFLLLVAGVILSTLLNPTLRAFGILKGWFFDPLLFFLLIRYAFEKKNNLHAPITIWRDRIKSPQALFCAYAVSGVVVASIALGYWFFDVVTYDGRVRAFFESPNHLAMYLAPAVLIASYWLLAANSWKKRILLSVICFLLFVVLHLTKSHGAWLGVFGALLFGWFAFKTSGKARMTVIAGVVVIGILLPIFTVQFWPSIQKTFDISERSSATSRMMIWRSAAAIGKEHALFGIGPGNFQERYLAYQKDYPPYLEWAVPQPHNIYLAFWLQTGLLGLTGFLFFLYWFFKILFSRLPVTRYSLLVTALMLYILLHGSVDTLYWKNDLSIFFWALLAWAVLAKTQHTQKDIA